MLNVDAVRAVFFFSVALALCACGGDSPTVRSADAGPAVADSGPPAGFNVNEGQPPATDSPPVDDPSGGDDPTPPADDPPVDDPPVDDPPVDDPPPTTCTPDCLARECGPDGCGGTCGTCGADQVCNGVGNCQGTAWAPETGACKNDDDVAVLEKGQVSGISEQCLYDNIPAIIADDQATLLQCLKDNTGLSDGCVECFGGLLDCTIKACPFQCMGGKTPECMSCMEQSCYPDYITCSGVNPANE